MGAAGSAGCCVAGGGCDAGCAAVWRTCSFGENQVGVPGSDARGTRGAHAGMFTGPAGGFVFGWAAGAADSSAACGDQTGRDGGPGCAGETGGSVCTGTVDGGGVLVGGEGCCAA